MLIEFSVENFLSFKERATLSLVASSDKWLPGNVIKSAQSTDLSLLKTAAVYGANASGKSNFLKAISFMTRFVLASHEMREGSVIDVIPFKLLSNSSNKPSSFEIIFLKKGVRYAYGFSADSHRIHREWLFYYPNNHQRLLFERENNRRRPKLPKFGTSWKGPKSDLLKLVRSNTLLLSVADQYNNEIAKQVSGWFFWLTFLFEANTSRIPYSSLLRSRKKLALRFLQKADLGILDYEIEEPESQRDNEPQFKPRPGIATVMSMGDAPLPKPEKITTTHLSRDHKGQIGQTRFRFEEESDGTRKAFWLFPACIAAFETGAPLFIDELDIHLHPLLSRWLISNWNDKTLNPKRAQLIFSTQDTSLLDLSLFRRDQIWFTEKDESGASSLFSLWDFKPRKPRTKQEENLRGAYLVGKFGAVPFLEYFLD